MSLKAMVEEYRRETESGDLMFATDSIYYALKKSKHPKAPTFRETMENNVTRYRKRKPITEESMTRMSTQNNEEFNVD